MTITQERHSVRRVRRETQRRALTVNRVEQLGSAMLRIWLEGEDLATFESASPDDHIKLFFPNETGRTMRDYTPRFFDTAARTMAIDFVLHDPAGPATAWAANAKPGDTLDIGGPRGSAVVSEDFDWYMLIGDETAIPQFSRRIEELPAGSRVVALVSVEASTQLPPIPSSPTLDWRWVRRGTQASPAEGNDPAPLLSALEEAGLPEGEGYIWVAAESSVTQRLRHQLTEVLAHPLPWLRASGYWTAGQAQD